MTATGPVSSAFKDIKYQKCVLWHEACRSGRPASPRASGRARSCACPRERRACRDRHAQTRPKSHVLDVNSGAGTRLGLQTYRGLRSASSLSPRTSHAEGPTARTAAPTPESANSGTDPDVLTGKHHFPAEKRLNPHTSIFLFYFVTRMVISTVSHWAGPAQKRTSCCLEMQPDVPSPSGREKPGFTVTWTPAAGFT